MFTDNECQGVGICVPGGEKSSYNPRPPVGFLYFVVLPQNYAWIKMFMEHLHAQCFGFSNLLYEECDAVAVCCISQTVVQYNALVVTAYEGVLILTKLWETSLTYVISIYISSSIVVTIIFFALVLLVLIKVPFLWCMNVFNVVTLMFIGTGTNVTISID